ncbi:tudor domain-containing protein 1 isoform X2 [Pungitius pungitius]|uniref:tudor domain-containing protein 1 isoform X2 n=1 Tax=Pungitius pungitius TaxID=134920 RepID=UPI002E168946
MYRAFSPNLVRPNLPLRKPSSGPVALYTPRPPAPATPLSFPDATAACTASGAIGDALTNVSVGRNQSALFQSTPPPLTVYFCNYCGQQGNLRCKRCKNTPYCSVACQAEDWKAHRHMCKSIDSEPQTEKPKETTASPLTGDTGSLLVSEQGNASSPQRVYLKDLHLTKIIKGDDIQASVLEFYNPGRFFLLAQNLELLEALQNISAELQKTYSCPSVTTYVPHVGEVCAVKFSCDLNWYRGLVQTLAADQKTANILYIDFGNEEDVPVDRIKPLAANIQPFCPCAMQCRIIGVVPTAGSWSSECCISVKKLLAGKFLTTSMVETQEDGRIHSVDITLSMGKKLSTFLLDHGYAEEEAVNTAPTMNEINALVTASLDNFRRLSDGKDDNTWAQLPEPLTQAVGDSFYVLITHLQSPNEMIVQKVENAGVIRELQLKLREHCSQVPAPQNFRPAPGTVCCAQFSEDKQWYRAKVLGYSSEERICVGYLDFGNSEEVDLANLQPISTSLLALPMQAIPCGLAGVRPVGESWTEDCLLALQRRVANRILHIEITGEHDGKLLVTMIDEASDPQANVAELLSSAGFAVPVSPVSDEQADQTASASVDPQEPTSACEPLVWSCNELPCDGQTVALLASVVENPQEFYCRIDNPTDHQRLMELGAQLKEHCEAAASPFVPKVGEPCCAMFPVDGKWYRAMVKALSEEVSVYFVDYGYTMKVEKNHLRSITDRLLTLPFQAICCWLTGVEPLGSEWSSEALLCFDTLVDGEQLSARVLSVTDRGYGLELKSRGKDVANALISEQLAKVPGALPAEAEAVSGHAHQEKGQENEHSPKHAHTNQVTGASLKEMPTEGQTATPSKVSAPGFPVDWKAVELPLNSTFQPRIAAFIGPSLFYIIVPIQDQQKLQEVMMELTVYCSDIQASSSSTVPCKPALGAACCAQFSADNNWYRAVVVEVDDNEASVIYADYGNAEKVPFSRILPIPMSLLQLPFHVTRCTLNGKEPFPANLPEEVQQMFENLLFSGVLATVQSFNGTENVLTLALPSEKGGQLVSAMISDALKARATSSPPKVDRIDSSASAAGPSALPEGLRSNSGSEKGPESTAAATGPPVDLEPESQTLQQRKNTSAVAVDDPQTSGCCCLKLTTKIDDLERLMQQQLSLIKLLVGQKK